jgi:hypothetical protein
MTDVSIGSRVRVMKSRVSLVAIFGLILTWNFLPLANADDILTGSACKEVGATATSALGQVKCVNEGGKLIWQIVTASPSPAIGTPTPTAKNVVQCVIGKTGPGGGIIFYDAGSLQRWGRCLEAAPKGWHHTVHDPRVVWCNNYTTFLHATVTSIGGGRSNTNVMLAHCASGAAFLAHAYHGGGKTDWYLPSKDELHALFLQQSIVGGGFSQTCTSCGSSGSVYWSSSETNVSNAWIHYFLSNNQYTHFKTTHLPMRPIRAFS